MIIIKKIYILVCEDKMIKKIYLILGLMALFNLGACVSYYDGYDEAYYASAYGRNSLYSYSRGGYAYSSRNAGFYNSPLRIRALSENDFYMLDHNPSDYFNVQLWS